MCKEFFFYFDGTWGYLAQKNHNIMVVTDLDSSLRAIEGLQQEGWVRSTDADWLVQKRNEAMHISHAKDYTTDWDRIIANLHLTN